jgi:hypothetical protein
MGVGAFDADVLELLQKYIEMRSRFGRIWKIPFNEF